MQGRLWCRSLVSLDFLKLSIPQESHPALDDGKPVLVRFVEALVYCQTIPPMKMCKVTPPTCMEAVDRHVQIRVVVVDDSLVVPSAEHDSVVKSQGQGRIEALWPDVVRLKLDQAVEHVITAEGTDSHCGRSLRWQDGS